MLRMTLSTQCDTKSLETTASNLQKKNMPKKLVKYIVLLVTAEWHDLKTEYV